MKLATLRNGSADGELVVVSRDLERAVRATDIAPNLLGALESWCDVEPRLRALAAALERGSVAETALGLGIAKTSVLTYRQRAYQRLGVTSPIALCALVTQ